MHASYLVVDGRGRRVLAQVEDRCPAAGHEHAVDLIESAHRVRKILERGATHHEIERLVGERHVRCVSMPKVDADTRFARVLGGDAHKGMADVEDRDAVIAQLGDFYRQVPGTGGHLKHLRSWLEAVSYGACAFLGSTHVVRRVPGVPRGDDAFHRYPLVRLFSSCHARLLPSLLFSRPIAPYV